jgi:3-isopropylmalate/(R)-2-methylmalate dehydratase small subunit
MENSSIRKQVKGRAIPVRGADIDTDRIIPARFLRTVTFDDLGQHAFEDDRVGGGHPFDEERFQGAAVLVTNANFGCGSSREHAPQSLMRWGIKVFVGESFAEIFYGNCIALGLPCVKASKEDVQLLQAAVEAEPGQEIEVDIEARVVRYAGIEIAVEIAAGSREQFVSGNWDSLAQLLDAGELVDATAKSLPYTTAFVAA